MNIALVGADLEENLGLGMIAAVAERAGHRVEVLPFSDPSQQGGVVARILSTRPRVLGLSLQFQHRAAEFLGLARSLRAHGYEGHITAGGQFPTLAFEAVLSEGSGIDSVVLHEGEESFVELLCALSEGRSLTTVAGLAVVGQDGRPTRTAPRRLVDDLDRFPFPKRYRPHTEHLGVPFIPIMGGRGCWGSCSFCSITSFLRDARAHGGGKLLRYRSPENIATEMALLWQRTQGQAIFCFHDDNFLMPRPDASLARLRAIRAALDQQGVGRVALIGKCRPDSLTRQLAQDLRALGVVRLYVGVENTSAPGARHLNRGIQTEQIHQALGACQEAGIFVCYNLLMFEPDATLEDIESNLDFVRAHAEHPFNFGRAEPYFGTPLQTRLAQRRNLSGTYLGHGYRIADHRTELSFRICAAAFRQRNYDADGVHNRAMGVGYTSKLVEHFYSTESPNGCRELSSRAIELTRRITLETVDFVEEALALVREVDIADRDQIERETALLGLRILEADSWQHAKLDQFFQDARTLSASLASPGTKSTSIAQPRRMAKLVRQMAFGTLLAAGLQGCDDGRMVVDPDVGPLDYMVVDPDVGPLDYMVVDPDVGPLDYMVVDPDVGPLDTAPGDTGVDGMVVDPDVGPLDDSAPSDAGVGEAQPQDSFGESQPGDAGLGEQASMHPLIDRWRDTAPRFVTRTTDLPLFDPPAIKLVATRVRANEIRVRLVGGPRALSTRWEGDGHLEGGDREVRWSTDCETDQLRVGVRSRGGIAVASLRAKDVATLNRS